MPSDTAAIVIASISGAVSIGAASIAAQAQRRLSVWQAEQARKLETQRSEQAKELEVLRSEQAKQLETQRSEQAKVLEGFRDSLARARDTESQAKEAERVVSKYRDPLLQSAFDLQSRIYNIYRPGGFRGRADPEYFRLNTLFVFAEFLGWLEIIRRELQFLDLRAVDATNQLGRKLSRVQDRLASTSTLRDDLFIFRGHQRAIAELMLSRAAADSSSGRQLECMGYAAFVEAQERPEFARWFERLGNAVARLPDTDEKPPRLVEVQHTLIDLIDLLDPECIRFQAHSRGRL